MKTYKMKRTVVGILLVILTLGFCVVGTGAARPDGMGGQGQGFGPGGQFGPDGQSFDGQTPPDFGGDFAPDGETPPDFDSDFGGRGGRGQFGPNGENASDTQSDFGGRGGQHGFGRDGDFGPMDGGARQAIEALEDGDAKSALLALLDEVHSAMEELRAADESSRESARAAVEAAREALNAALSEAGIETDMTPPELPDGENAMIPPELPDGTNSMTPPELPNSENGMTPPEKPEGSGGQFQANELNDEQMQNLFQQFLSWLKGSNT